MSLVLDTLGLSINQQEAVVAKITELIIIQSIRWVVLRTLILSQDTVNTRGLSKIRE